MSDRAEREQSIGSMLVAWARYHARASVIAMRPRLRANDVAAVAAGSGQPTGA